MRILGRLEVIETHKRGIIAMLWIGIFRNFKGTHHSHSLFPRQTAELSPYASASSLSRYLLTIWLPRHLTSLCLLTAHGLVTLPTPKPLHPPYNSILLYFYQLYTSLSATRSVCACISSTWLLLKRELVRPIALHPTWQTDSFRLSISYQFYRHLLHAVISVLFRFQIFFSKCSFEDKRTTTKPHDFWYTVIA